MALTPDDLAALVITPHIVLRDSPTQEPHCLAVLRWAYREHFNIVLPTDYIRLLGFFKRVEEPTFMDACIMSIRKPFTDHIGVMLSAHEFVHYSNQKSQMMVSRVNDIYWGEFVVAFLRLHELPPRAVGA